MADKTAAAAEKPPAPVSDADTVARLGAQRRKWKDAAGRLVTERDLLKKELDEIKSKPVDQTAVQLRAELRKIKHRQVFDKIAVEMKVKPEGLDDLYKLSGYVAKDDVADEEGIKTLIQEQSTARAYLFGEPTPLANGTPAPLVKPGVGTGQGKAPAGAPQLSLHDPADVSFWFKNYAGIAASAKERIGRGEV